MTPYHSHLPHWKRSGVPCFLTWRLAGSLPAQKRRDAADSRISRFAFDRAAGPDWLLRADVAETVVRAIFTGRDKGFYELGSWVVMPNHVHMLLRPLVELSRVVAGIKVSSARDANRLLDRSGAFWSRDYFDRWIRDSDGEQRVVRYIENNPVKAGLCREAADWRFSSAGQRG